MTAPSDAPRVRLRPYAEGDFALLERSNAPEMTEHLGGPESDEKLRDRHQRYVAIRDKGTGQMFIIEMLDGTAVGNIGYWDKEWQDEAVYETGWSVFAEFWGQGLAAEAASLVAAEARAAGTRRYLHAFPSVEHAASNAVCRKAGFELAGQYDFEYPPGHPLLTNDWRLDLHTFE